MLNYDHTRMGLHIHKLPNKYSSLYPAGVAMDEYISLAKDMADVFTKVEKTKKSLNIFCRGSSGAMLSALFASNIRDREVLIIHVKKDGERSHSSTTHNSNVSTERWVCNDDFINIIIDDFIRSGETVNEIYKRINQVNTTDIDYLIIHDGYSSSDIRFKPRHIISND